MSGAALIIRFVTATIAIIAVGAVAVFGYIGIIEPFSQAISGPPTSLGWGDPGGSAVVFASLGLLALMLVIVIWLIAAPIRQDQRQQFRR